MIQYTAVQIQQHPAFWNLCGELMLASNKEIIVTGIIVSIELLIL